MRALTLQDVFRFGQTENDTLARIGTACLQQLVEDNVDKLSADRWERIVSTFVHLFKTTTAYQLFDPTLLHPQYDSGPGKSKAQSPASEYAPLAPAPAATVTADGSPIPPPKPAQPVDRRRVFRQIIVKCVLQLLLIETTHELLQHERVYKTIPPGELLRLMAALDESYRFARKFNADKDLRMALWKVGFMRDLPNLLRQESTSAATLVNVLLRMHNDVQPEAVQKRAEVIDVFVPYVPTPAGALWSLDSPASSPPLVPPLSYLTDRERGHAQTRARRARQLCLPEPGNASAQYHGVDSGLHRDLARVLQL